MFLIIPLILIAGSVAGISYIVRSKIKEIKSSKNFSEVKKDFWHLILPEFFNIWGKIDFQGFKKNALADYEKFLRRVRILSLKTDNFVNKLLEKRQKKTVRPEFKETFFSDEPKANVSNFKAKENSLIAEIARNPKDKNLYKMLGAFYLKNEMLSDAREVFDVVLELDPNDGEAKEALEKIIH
ncbi:MAG: tetratricopeptide repeat protein [Patescibacteria group bacterium]